MDNTENHFEKYYIFLNERGHVFEQQKVDFDQIVMTTIGPAYDQLKTYTVAYTDEDGVNFNELKAGEANELQLYPLMRFTVNEAI
jgi:hypothetical protein